MFRLAIWLLSALWLASPGVLLSVAPRATGGDTLCRLLPADPLGRAHVPSGLAVWDSAAGRNARALAEESGVLAELEPLRGAIRLATGTDPAATLRFLLGGELAFAVYDAGPAAREGTRPPRALVVLARTSDPDGLKLAVDALLSAADREHDVRRQHYRKQPYARLDHKLLVAAMDGVLLLATNDDLLDAVIDRRLDEGLEDGDPPVLAAEPADADGATTLATFTFDAGRLQPADLRPLQQPGRKLLGRRVANPLANLLFGGLTLAEGRIDGTLAAHGDELALHAVLPAPPADAPAAWFPPGEDGFAVPTTPETLAVLSTRRDLADWWRQRETLMSEESQPGLAEADTNIGLLFAGKSPAEDVFAAVAPELALVVDRQRFEGGVLVPVVRLPGFCLVGRLRDTPGFADTLGVAFQSLLGFMNTERAQDGKPPFLIDVQVHEGVVVRSAHLVPRETDDAASLGIDPNWSPTVAVADDWMLLGSSTEQVRRLISAIHGGGTGARDGTLDLDLDVTAALGLAGENRAALVANRMLEQGQDADEAGRDIDNILRAASRLTRLQAGVRRTSDNLLLELKLALRPVADAPAASDSR